MTKSEMIQKLENIDNTIMNAVTYFIKNSNPNNEATRNNARIYYSSVNGHYIHILSKATKENIYNVLTAVQSEMLALGYIDEAAELLPTFPEWYTELKAEEAEKEYRAAMVDQVRELCINNNWYTFGTNEEYNNMFDMIRNGESPRSNCNRYL